MTMFEKKPGTIEKYLYKKREEEGALFMSVIDPVDHPSVARAVSAAKATAEAGADAIVVGGSIAAQNELLDQTVDGIKQKTDLPVILFPGNIGTISGGADAIYFMSMVNSRNPYWTFTAHLMASPVIKRLNVEPLPTAYVMVWPGGTAGWVGDCKLVPPNKPKLAAYSAKAAEYLGARFVITDVGSASPNPVPTEMVSAVRKETSNFYVVAGGIKTEKQIRDIVSAGADAIHIGTAIEQAKDVKGQVSKLIKACKSEGKKTL